MSVKFSNNGKTTLSSGISSTATSITVADASVFPSITGSEYFYMTLEDVSGNVEIVKVTSVSSNTLTVTRAQESSSGRAFSAGDKAENRLTAGGLNDVATQADTDTDTTYSAGSGLSLSGTTFSNTAPDQTVALTGSGATSVSGTYPNFTISSTDNNTTYSVGDGGLTQKNFTTTLKSKLDGIEASADVTDTANVVAALTAGTNVDIAADGTISSTDTNTTYSVGDGGLTQKNFTTALKTKLDGIETSADVTDATNVSAAGALMKSGGTMTGDLEHGDNIKAVFGASDDLQMYHDGSHSYIKEQGTGNLYFTSDGLGFKFQAGWLGTMYDAMDVLAIGTTIQYLGSPKFTVGSTGAEVFGDLVLSDTTGDNLAGPELTFERNSDSPADADYLGQIKFKGKNDASQEVLYSKITGKIDDASDGTEDGIIEYAVKKAGANVIVAKQTKNAFKLLNGTGLEVAGNITVDGTVDGRDVAADGSKLDGVEASADVTDTTNVVAALTAGTNVSIAADGTISSTDTNTTYSVGDGGLTQKNFTTTLKSKLDGIASGAEVNVNADWNASSGDAQILNKPTIPSLSGYATESYVGTQISNLVDSSPSTLNTLNELAAALGDDANFSTTVSNQIGTKWTQDNTKISNWDTAYGWGNHASAGYLTSFDITTQTDSKYLRSDTSDSMSGNLSLGDSNELRLGASNDLKLYHDGSHSYIDEAGTGSLFIKSDGLGIKMQAAWQGTMYDCIDVLGPFTTIKSSGVTKLQVSSTGIAVTGTITADSKSVGTQSVVTTAPTSASGFPNGHVWYVV